MAWPADWVPREPFLSGDAWSCAVDGRPQRIAQVSLRSMNFGQHWRTPRVVDAHYEVTLPLGFAVAVLDRLWDDHVDDSRRFPDPKDALESRLRVAGWPRPAAALDDERLTGPLLRCFGYDVLLQWLGDGPPDAEPGWVLNTIASARRAGDRIVFTGAGRAADPPQGERLAYQDV